MKYTNLYHVEPYKERVDRLETYFSNQSNNAKVLNVGRQRLREDITILEHKERELFQKLNVKNADELEIRFHEISQEMSHFSGLYLRESLLIPLYSEKDANRAKFIKAIEELVKKWLLEQEGVIIENCTEEVKLSIEVILRNLNKDKKKKIGLFHQRKQSNFSDSITFALATKSRVEKLQKLLKEEWIKVQKEGRKKSNQTFYDAAERYFEVEAGGSENVTWFTITEQKTAAHFDDETKKNKSEKLLKYLEQFLPLPEEKKALFRESFWHVILKSDYNAIFVGKNIKQITGLLGEIAGIYYLCRLFGCHPDQSKEIVKESAFHWRGGLGNPHQDIQLYGKGIQIKNSSQDFLNHELEIDFMTSNLKTFLDRVALMGLSESAILMLENYFRTYEFNVPYAKIPGKKKPIFVEKVTKDNREKFLPSREKLEQVSKDVDLLLSAFASSFMYMDVGKKTGEDTNLLFITANATIKTASELLRKVLHAMNTTPQNMPVRVKSSLDDNKVNIVSVLNKDPSALEKKEEIKDINSKYDSVSITTAYRFNIASFLSKF